MEIEEEIMVFGETAVCVECDLCGRSFGGPGVSKAIVAVGQVNVCLDCLRKVRKKWGTSAEGVGLSRPA
jgi:ribosome-binding protein aMBF1 (putative translation factor)